MNSPSQEEHKKILITTPIQPLPTHTDDQPQVICKLRYFLDKPTSPIKKGDVLHLWGTVPTAHNAMITGTVGKIVKHEKYMVTIMLLQPNQSNVTLHLRLPASHLKIPRIVQLRRSLEFLVSRKVSPPLPPLFTESSEVFFERVYTP